ncbi:MAG: RimK family protein [Planctomycetota bacterium]
MLIVVDDPADWPLSIDGVSVVTGDSYITDPQWQATSYRGEKVFNCCRSYRYQSIGYYVSLLAEARGHKPLPGVTTIQDLRTRSVVRVNSDELDELIQTALKPLKSEEFTLSIYFGRNMAKRYEALCRRLYRLFPAPFLRAQFGYQANTGQWALQFIGPISLRHVPQEHWNFVHEAATAFFAGKEPRARKKKWRFDMAILYDEKEKEGPSNRKAIDKFTKAAEAVGFRVEEIGKEDYGRIGEFDALFIRQTTAVQHHTYRFARRAAADGVVVIDDPVSIFRCCNKVFLAELLTRYGINAPKTMIVHKGNVDQVVPTLGLPTILKQPDSSFSQGVVKVDTPEALAERATMLLEISDLFVAQEFVPTPFDWRIGVLDRKPLYAARYHMAPKHWQIIKRDGAGTWIDEGNTDTLPVDVVPAPILRTAVRAANLIGDGLYGVDMKQVGNKALVIEINDNPSIDCGWEDKVLGNKLYDEVMRVFLERVEKAKARLAPRGEAENGNLP